MDVSECRSDYWTQYTCSQVNALFSSIIAHKTNSCYVLPQSCGPSFQTINCTDYSDMFVNVNATQFIHHVFEKALNDCTVCEQFEGYMRPTERQTTLLIFGLVTIRIIGVLGNLIVIFATFFIREMRTHFYVSLATLAVADTLYLTLNQLPLFGKLMFHSSGYFGPFMCYLSSMCYNGPLACSTILVTFISIERYVAIIHPFKAREIFSGRRIMRFLIPIVVICFMVDIPLMPYVIYRPGAAPCFLAYCDIPTYPENEYHAIWTIEMTVICVFQFLPMGILIMLYILMARKLSKLDIRSSSHVNKRQAIMMMGVVSCVFVVCIVPMSILRVSLYAGHLHLLQEYISDTDPEFPLFFWSSRFAQDLNCMVNPIIYAAVSKDFRRKIAITCKRFRRVCFRWCKRGTLANDSTCMTTML